MPLNKQKGNMYAFVTHTWNPIRGKCPHNCSYCYMKVYPQGEFRFVEKELNTNLGKDNFIFVGSSTDMWCSLVHNYWVEKILYHCRQYNNRYLFQSKNPYHFSTSISMFPDHTILGTTIESNRASACDMSNAPPPWARSQVMRDIVGFPKMVSIEPIMDFDLDILSYWIKGIKPEFVSIGADSKEHKLPEPSTDKLQALIDELQGFTIVKLKDNLKRLLGNEVGDIEL